MSYKINKQIILSIILFFLQLNLFSQSIRNVGSLEGSVVNDKNQSVEAVLVGIKGTNIATNTDSNGKFLLHNIPVGKNTVQISGLGIEGKEQVVQIVENNTSQLLNIRVKNSVDLNEVVVTGKTEARKQQELAYPITVLDISKLYNTSGSLNKLLNNVSSVRVREDGGVGSNYSFNINGFSGKQVKFFIDGIPMDNFGTSFNLSNISMSMADRIDVYKGVLPVNLGADALGGAVNIITRKKANYIDASYSYGSFNTNKAAINGAYTDLKTGFTIRLNSFFNYSDNDYKVYVPIVDLATNKELRYENVKRFHDKYRSGGIRSEIGVINKSFADYLLFGLIWSKNNADVQNGATMDAVYGGVKSKSESLIPSLKWKKDDLFVEGLSASVYGAYSSVTTYAIDTLSRKYNWLGEFLPKATHGEGLNTDSKTKNHEWSVNTNISYMLNKYQSLMLNNTFLTNKRTILDNIDPDNESNKMPKKLTKNITGLGWLATYERWNVNLFMKMYNLHSTSSKIENQFKEDQRLVKINVDKTNIGYGGAFTYFLLPKLQLKASYEHAYRLPENNEIFGDGLYQKANPNLKPEKSDNLNIGFIFEHNFNDHIINVEANGLFRYTQDFIHKDLTQGSNPTTGYTNLGKVNTSGIEGSIHYKYKYIYAGASITYQNIKDKQKTESNDNSYVGATTTNYAYNMRIPNIPYLYGNANAGLRIPNFAIKDSELSFDYTFYWSQSYYLSFPGLGTRSTKDIIPSQAFHDIALSYSLAKGKYNIGFECTNITNRRLYDNYRLQKPGRAFNLKFRYFLNW